MKSLLAQLIKHKFSLDYGFKKTQSLSEMVEELGKVIGENLGSKNELDDSVLNAMKELWETISERFK